MADEPLVSDVPRPAGPDPERDARVAAYRDRERRRAARALDRYIELMNGPDPDAGAARVVAAERFIEQVGDYVLSRLHHNGDYGVTPRFPEGTPEYEAYRAELRIELGKFARGDEPYPYDPCGGGRCPDPAAHAEGAHDV